jgi:hypothetical protein
VSSMGMDRTGASTQVLPTSTSYTQLTGMAVRSGYASTVLTSNRLVMNTTGTGTLRYNVIYSTNFGTGQNMRLVKNGSTVIGTSSTAGTIVTTAAQSIVPGDTFELQASCNLGGSFQNISAGNTTFLEYNELTAVRTVNGTATDTWARSGTLAVSEVISGTATDIWGRTGSLAVSEVIGGQRTDTWGISGSLYKGASYDVDGARAVNWAVVGGILLIPKPTALPTVFDVQDVSASIHTVDGRRIGDLPCDIISTFTWGRESSEVSTCSVVVATQGDPDLLDELIPWVHWLTLWHDDIQVWTGPIQTVKIGSATATISARDTATFMARTRVPVSRTWIDTHTENIASDLWKTMLQIHGIKVTPTILTEVVTTTFTVTAVAQQAMFTSLMDNLVKVGLVWTVVAGRPVFGVFSSQPIASLEECDFMVELERQRDGTATFNDVRLQGQNWAQNAKVELAGLNLQTLVSLDDISGVGNIQRAALQYVKDSATIRDALVVPTGASLDPQAPVTLNDLVPGKVFLVNSGTISQLMRLDQVTVAGSSSGIDVQVGLVALSDPDQIATLISAGGSSTT